MIARLALWTLADSQSTLAEIRPQLPLDTSEVWFSDDASERLGSFAVFPDAEAATAPFPEHLRELIGKEPDVIELFDVEQ